MNTIKIGNRRVTSVGEYCGRPSALGNPEPMRGEADRDRVIRWFEDWFAEQLLDPASPASVEFARLVNLARQGNLRLLCWCSPRRCHTEIIKRTIEFELRRAEKQ